MMEAGGQQAAEVAGGQQAAERQTLIPTLIEWKSSACGEVYVFGSWDNWQTTTMLHRHGKGHSAVVYLQPGNYWVQFLVDRVNYINPSLPMGVFDGSTYNVLSVNEASVFPTLFEFNCSANEVFVYGSWDNYKGTKLDNHEQLHAIWLHLPSGCHLFYYRADGADTYDPYLSWKCINRKNCNVLNVSGSSTKPQCYKASMVAITLTHKCESVAVSGSWDNWKTRWPLHSSLDDHYTNLELHPGWYHVKFYVDGKEGTSKNTSTVFAREAQNHYLHGCNGAELLDDCIALSGEMLSFPLKFNVGSRIGSIDQKEKGYPCTKFGYMLLGVLGFVKETYRTGFSWGGCFGPEDIVIVDGQHPQIRAEATYQLTRAHIILDSLRLKSVLFSRFMSDGKFPPYFTAMFDFLESPPEDLDTNPTSMNYFLDIYDNQAALASPPRRMLVLVNMAQFMKQLPKHLMSTYALAFVKLVGDFPNWRLTSYGDSLLKMLYEHRKKVKFALNGDRIEPFNNTALELSNFLRIFFVHGPEHTLVQAIQQLKSFSEFDLIIAHYFDKLLSELICLIRNNMGKNAILKAIWDFYCGGSPPDHISALNCVGNPPEYYEMQMQ